MHDAVLPKTKQTSANWDLQIANKPTPTTQPRAHTLQLSTQGAVQTQSAIMIKVL
jgi:hypothetical protein